MTLKIHEMNPNVTMQHLNNGLVEKTVSTHSDFYHILRCWYLLRLSQIQQQIRIVELGMITEY